MPPVPLFKAKWVCRSSPAFLPGLPLPTPSRVVGSVLDFGAAACSGDGGLLPLPGAAAQHLLRDDGHPRGALPVADPREDASQLPPGAQGEGGGVEARGRRSAPCALVRSLALTGALAHELAHVLALAHARARVRRCERVNV
eukprot:659954-Pleurochrysis_carterae.AAC.2